GQRSSIEVLTDRTHGAQVEVVEGTPVVVIQVDQVVYVQIQIAPGRILRRMPYRTLTETRIVRNPVDDHLGGGGFCGVVHGHLPIFPLGSRVLTPSVSRTVEESKAPRSEGCSGPHAPIRPEHGPPMTAHPLAPTGRRVDEEPP